MSSAMEKLFAVPLVGKCCDMLIEGDPNLKLISILFGSISLDYFAMGMVSTTKKQVQKQYHLENQSKV